MARCNDSTCSCLVQGGSGIVVRGSGTASNPYVIDSTVSLAGALIVNDTPTVDLSIWGSGTLADPYRLTANASLSMQQLSDVADPQGGPAVGDVPIWVGSGSDGHFEFQPPPASPPGAVNVERGIRGVGSVAAPIKAAVFDETPGPVDGLRVYVDVDGDLRVVPPTAQAVDWASITGRPNTFPPSAHTHTMAQITDYQFPTWDQIRNPPGSFPPAAHTHVLAQITDYQFPTWDQVRSKPASFTPSAHDVNGAVHTGLLSVANGGTGANNAASARANIGAQVAGSYAASSHTHPISQITDLGNASVANATTIGGRRITVSASAPGSPATNDLWIY